MSSYVTRAECDEYMVKRRPDYTFTTREALIATTCLSLMNNGDTWRYRIAGVLFNCYVIKVDYRTAIDSLSEWTITLRPTGAPIPEMVDKQTGIRMRCLTEWDKKFRVGKTIDVKLPKSLMFHPDAFAMASKPFILQDCMTESLRHLKEQLKFTNFVNREYGDTFTATGKKEKRMKVRNRFYVAATSVTSNSEQAQDNTSDKVHLAVSSGDRHGKWTRKNLKDAIKHAEDLLELEPSKDHVAIVQIVRVVRRKKAPVVVEVVR